MSHHDYRSSAPLGVKVLAALTALDGLIAMLSGLGWLVVLLPVGALVIGVGAVQLLIGYGLWKLEPYAYSWGLAMFGLGALLDLFTGNLHGAGLSLINAYVLYHYRDLFRTSA